MKVLVTGATGFVGGWLVPELERAGHEVTPAPRSSDLDLADLPAVREFVHDVRPDVIAHLAAVASSQHADRDLGRAVRTNIGGTVAMVEALRALEPSPGILVVSSAEVYAAHAANGEKLDEQSAIGPRHPYGLLKLAQESIALEAAHRHGLAVVVARPFNHVGPGQPPIAAVPSFAAGIAAVLRGDAERLSVGNLDVERDITDVRDVVVAYRLLLEQLGAGEPVQNPSVYNVASGVGVSLRWIVDELMRLAGGSVPTAVDPERVRTHDPPRIIGDATLLRGATGWRPQYEPTTTLGDVLAAQLR
ncbi:MAG: NAD-dependent epimerase/dehydratase family protein [Candidatus Limnocylindria bacterium]